ncbi:DnaJ domain-containing protein [Hamiltosporidium tvaerminnensis]|uniref:DnaJ domain-containing protein n=1 Tax=Hamiltosporidium tvaerminnensis TaxID=1176355 RepID=A0A4Q9LTQ4_9MICR|nr:DnaJ domain-containing protein [Hamiltosporidium tvaerminnensis]
MFQFFIIVWLQRLKGRDSSFTYDDAMYHYRIGDVQQALDIFTNLHTENSSSTAVNLGYAKVLYSCGKYKKILDLFNEEKNESISEIVENARMNKKKAERNLEENIEDLYTESPYNIEFLEKIVLKKIKKNLLVEALQLLSSKKSLVENNKKLLQLKALIFVFQDKIEAAEDIFIKEFRDNKTMKQFKSIRQEYKNIENIRDKRQRFYGLRDFLLKIDTLDLGSLLPVSIYHNIKLGALKELLSIGIHFKAKGLVPKAELYNKMADTDNSRYIYVLAYLYSGNISEAYSLVETLHFEDEKYRSSARSKILTEKQRMKEEEEEERERQRQQEEWQKQQRRSRRGTKKSDDPDPKGYYKSLGVQKTATKKEIKKAYIKAARKYNPDLIEDAKEKEKMTKKLMEINSAKSVLLDDEKRKDYDDGIIEGEEPFAQDFDQKQFSDIFSMFFGGAGGNMGGAGGSRFFSSSRPGQQQTYYYYSY